MRDVPLPTLTSERLILRPFTVQDAPAMYANWAHDDIVTKFVRWPPHQSLAETEALCTRWQREGEDGSNLNWAIVRKSDGAVMGSIGVVAGEEDGLPEPGYCLGQAFWRQGYTTEALFAVCDYMFLRQNVPEMHCCHAVENPASGAVMRKAGFTYTHEAVYHKFDGTEVPCLCYTLKKENYEPKRRNRE